MNDLNISKVLTNNGVTIAYELSNGRQITLENAVELVKNGSLKNLSISKNSLGQDILIASSGSPYFENIPFENINKPSD
ncbi:hypothetical protein [uncultured Clostridium sp.]|uniref:hypothetical protein n=1 Tax=uncultured Clostridium sp. TaxID=59620 RepID=UPI00262EA57D|nr:hypothetical protein [uncultured Clostridium sp.]